MYLPVVFSLKYFIGTLSKEVRDGLCNFLEDYNVAWDACLSLFSFFGSYHCLSYLMNEGYSCDFVENDNVMLWIELFCVSKIPELLDTVFIVLRSKPLILLQYYHHLATLVLCYFGFYIIPKNIIIAAAMNYTVHTVMYAYFAIVGSGYRSIRKTGFLITIMQLMQMVVAVYILLTEDMRSCLEPNMNVSYVYYYSLFMYGSYVFLFGKLLIEKIR